MIWTMQRAPGGARVEYVGDAGDGPRWRVWQGEDGRRRWYVDRDGATLTNAGGRAPRSWATAGAARLAVAAMAEASAALLAEHGASCRVCGATIRRRAVVDGGGVVRGEVREASCGLACLARRSAS